MGRIALKRMDNAGIVGDDPETTIDFFRELALELEGRARSKEKGPFYRGYLPPVAVR
jgi:hypothetical protein